MGMHKLVFELFIIITLNKIKNKIKINKADKVFHYLTSQGNDVQASVSYEHVNRKGAYLTPKCMLQGKYIAIFV